MNPQINSMMKVDPSTLTTSQSRQDQIAVLQASIDLLTAQTTQKVNQLNDQITAIQALATP